MRVASYCRAFLLVTVVSAAGSLADVGAQTGAAGHALPAIEKPRRGLDTLLDDDHDASWREAWATEALAANERMRRRLAKAARSEYRRRRNRYLDLFTTVTSEMTPATDDAGVAAEIELLRADALRVGHSVETTADDIRRTCDPAIMRLASLIAWPPGNILASSDRLAAERADVLWLASLWRRAAAGFDGIDGPGSTESVEAMLVDDEALAGMLAWNLSEGDRRTLEENANRSKKMDSFEVEAVRRVNAVRLLLGLRALTIDFRLAAAGRSHSSDMQKYEFRGHVSPVAGKREPADRVSFAGTTASGENIAVGPPTPAEAVTAWWYSPSHLRVMIGDDARIGIGRQGVFWTMVTGKAQAERVPDATRDPRADDPPPPPAPPREPPPPPPPSGTGSGG